MQGRLHVQFEVIPTTSQHLNVRFRLVHERDQDTDVRRVLPRKGPSIIAVSFQSSRPHSAGPCG